MTTLFQSIGIIVVLCIIIIVFVGLMYISYILGIAIIIIGSVAGLYYFLRTIKTTGLDI